MTETTRYDLELLGCTPEPLMAYLKALGILRLVSEQKDAEARGWWKNDTFWLQSTLEKDSLVDFFLREYKPTPIVAPWAGGSGFFSGDNVKAVDALCGSNVSRCKLYSEVIHHTRRIIKAEQITDKPKDKDKVRLIRRYRQELPDEVVAWMDAAMVLQQDGQGFAPLLGTGGNDGRLDFTQNFMQRIVSLGLHESSSVGDKSLAWLNQALFGSPARLDSASVGQFSPGRSGGPNATQGMEGESTDNPWDFVLMLEGTLLLAGAAVRRFGVGMARGGTTQTAFPFTVRAVAAGFDSSASRDEAQSRGELWLPLWSRPTRCEDVRQLFGEGRADVSGRPAQDGVDFARAVAGLGVDRGVAGFSRFAFLKRSGKAYLAAPFGRFEVAEHSEVDLLRQIDDWDWLNDFRRKCAAGRDKEEAPKRIVRTLNGIDASAFEFCKYGGPQLFQNIVIALGRTERELAVTEGKFKKKAVKPIPPLTPPWIDAANDGSAEFAVARALASIHDPQQKIGPLRVNLESVDWKKNCRAWAEKDRAVVWNAADLSTNLANVLQRRMMDGQRAGCECLPLASHIAVPLDIIAAFIAGELDDQRIEDLIWGLMLINPSCISGKAKNTSTPPTVLPRHYALLKLLFLPGPLVADRPGDRLHWRLARDSETGIAIRPEPRILPLLRAGRIGEACAVTARRLRISGLPPMPGPVGGVVRDLEWLEYPADHRRAQRLAAALLIPISSESVDSLVHLVCRDQSAAAQTLAVSAEGESE